MDPRDYDDMIKFLRRYQYLLVYLAVIGTALILLTVRGNS